MTPHNTAKPGDYAESVLLPGDPLRAKWVAETFLKDAKLVNSVRNCLGYTGTWNGKPVSVQATGMGQPSLSIYVHELINVYGLKRLIRIGTCGGLNADGQGPRPDPRPGGLDRFHHRQGRLRRLQLRAHRRLRPAARRRRQGRGQRHALPCRQHAVVRHLLPSRARHGRLRPPARPRRHRRRNGIGRALHPRRPVRRQGADHLHHDRLSGHQAPKSMPKPARPRSRTWSPSPSTSRPKAEAPAAPAAS